MWIFHLQTHGICGKKRKEKEVCVRISFALVAYISS